MNRTGSVTRAELANLLHSLLGGKSTSKDHNHASDLAGEILAKYELIRRPPKPKPWKDKPRGGGLW